MSTISSFQRCCLRAARRVRCNDLPRCSITRQTIRLASKTITKRKYVPNRHIALHNGQTAQRSATSIDIPIRGTVHPTSAVWLRDACPCSACVDPSTRQKNFATVDIPEQITGKATRSDDGSVTIEWINDIPGSPAGHSTTFSELELRTLFDQLVEGEYRTHGYIQRETWTDDQFRSSTSDIPYDEYMNQDSVLKRALEQLRRHGLMFLTGVPQTESAIIDVAERVGPLKNTFYGLTWDVRSVPEAKNVAYTSGDLGFHMDLMYVFQPPSLQLLHCIRSSAKGGASRFTDIYGAIIELLHTDRKAFDALISIPIGYHYDHPTQYYTRARRVVEVKMNPDKLATNSNEYVAYILGRPATRFAWSPPFQAPFQKGQQDSVERSNAIDQWHAAARKLNEILHRPENVHERMLGSGDLVIFDNRRVLHARTAFEVGDAGVERWLKGAYIDFDVWGSKLSTLDQQLRK